MGSRRALARAAGDIRRSQLRDGAPPEVIVGEIVQALPGLHPLEAWRFAHGWSRSDLSARIDALYETDGLVPPHLSDAELCRWEHGKRRPNAERIDYLCRVYRTRPDRLGYGVDHSTPDIDHLQRAGITDLWPATTDETLADLRARIQDARRHITVFGLTRNFYARDDVLPLFEARAIDIPVTFYVMAPDCDSRRDRYRIEPATAAMEDPRRYIREVLRPLLHAAQRVAPAASEHAGLHVLTYNFPCSFAIEAIDDACRVMLYGHGKRGTEGPILVFNEGTPFHDYFADQLHWLASLARDPREPWTSKGITVRRLEAQDLIYDR